MRLLRMRRYRISVGPHRDALTFGAVLGRQRPRRLFVAAVVRMGFFRRVEFGVAACKLVTRNGPLLAPLPAYDPVAVGRSRGTLQGIDGFTRVRRAGLTPSLSVPLPIAGRLVGVPENIVAYGPDLSVFLHRPIA